jgi:hypothetical protein
MNVILEHLSPCVEIYFGVRVVYQSRHLQLWAPEARKHRSVGSYAVALNGLVLVGRLEGRW